MPNPWRDLKGLPRESWILFWAVLVNRMGTMVVPFLTLYVIEELKGTEWQASLILFAYGFGSFVTAPISGRLSDRIGAVPTMKLSMAMTGVLMLLLSTLSGLWLFALVSFITAVVNEAFRPASMVYVANAVPPERKRQAFALNRLAVNLGMSVGPAAGGFLAAIHFPALYWVDGVTSLLAFASLFLLPQVDTAAVEKKKAAPMREALSDRTLVLFLLAVFPVIFVFLQHVGPVPIFMVRDLGLTKADFGLTGTVNTLLVIFLEIPLASWLAKHPNRYSLAGGSLLVGFGMGLFVFANGFWGCAVAVVFWTFGEMFLFPAMAAHVSEIAPKEKLGEYMGYYSMAWALAFLLGPPAGTLLYSSVGGAILWPLMFALGVLSAVIFWKISPKDR